MTRSPATRPGKAVYVVAAELSGIFTDTPPPGTTFFSLLQAAATPAVEAAGLQDRIQALYTGAMGLFAAERLNSRNHIGMLPVAMVSKLGLRKARPVPMFLGSSEAGAWACLKAWEDLRYGDQYDTLLVLAGEKMNFDHKRELSKAARARSKELERHDRNRVLAGVVDPVENRSYGLTMIGVGDLLLSRLAHEFGIPRERWRETILPYITLAKYRRTRNYPYGQFAEKQRLRGPIDLAAYERPNNREITPFFRLHDVCSTPSGAVAIVLTTDRKLAERHGPPVQLLAMGQGYSEVALHERHTPIQHSSAIRRAFFDLCRNAGVDLSFLKHLDHRAILHDAFPSIELMFLSELGFGPEEVLRRMTQGWSNPYGGLKGCGHAVGASGLLQVAKAFHILTRDPRYIYDPGQQTGRVCLTTSVGAALTNVVTSLVALDDDTLTDRIAEAPFIEDKMMHMRTLQQLWDDEDELRKTKGIRGHDEVGYVVAHTQVPPRTLTNGRTPDRLHIIETDRGKDVVLAEDAHPVGTVVRYERRSVRGKSSVNVVSGVESEGETTVATPELNALVDELEAELRPAPR